MNEWSDNNDKSKSDVHQEKKNGYFIDRSILTGVSNGVIRTFMIWLRTHIIYQMFGLFIMQACDTEMADRYRSIL